MTRVTLFVYITISMINTRTDLQYGINYGRKYNLTFRSVL